MTYMFLLTSVKQITHILEYLHLVFNEIESLEFQNII